MTVQELAELEGFDDVTFLLEEHICDSLCPAICTNTGCDHQDELEHDARNVTCPDCNTKTVQSIMVLEGII